MNAEPAQITLDQWDRRYASCWPRGCASRPTAGRCGGTWPTATCGCCELRFDNSPAALRLWNFLLTEESGSASRAREAARRSSAR